MSDTLDLLGGAQRGRTRVRGFAEWTPSLKSRELLDQVLAVLALYAAYLPLTLRQIFYRLVGAHGYEKAENAYARLGELVNRARRAQLIPMDHIRDDGEVHIEPFFYSGPEHFWQGVGNLAGGYRLDRQLGQPRRRVLIPEAAGMASQFQWLVDEFSIPVLSSGGFDSTTEKYQIAARIAAHREPVEVLNIGDHDASGAHMFLAFLEDVEAFIRDIGGDAVFTRLAVTPQQIGDLDLPTAPPKASDKRAFRGDTAQAEAIAPDMLASIVR